MILRPKKDRVRDRGRRELLKTILSPFSILDQNNLITLLQRDEFSVLRDDADLVVAAVPALPDLYLPADTLRISLIGL